MPIVTSEGEHFEDPSEYAFHLFGQGNYDPKTDTFTSDNPEPKELYYVRHGEPHVLGWDKTSLNDSGRADAAKAAEKLSKEPVTHIVTSDLPRASETASIIGDKLGITPEVHPGLRAWNVGYLSGESTKEKEDEVCRLALHSPDERPEGGETFNEFSNRIQQTVGQIAQEHKEHEVLMVSHSSPGKILNNLDQETGEVDRKAYIADKSIEPGKHQKFTIEDPENLSKNSDPITGRGITHDGMTNTTGWMNVPNFQERWQGEVPVDQFLKEWDQKAAAMGLQNETEDPTFSIHNYLRNNRRPPPGWVPNALPKEAPQFQPRQYEKSWQKQGAPQRNNPRYPSLEWQRQNPFPKDSDAPDVQNAPFDPEEPQVYNFPVSMKDEPPNPFPNIIPMLKDMKKDPIAARAEAGMSIRAIAKAEGLHPSKVQRILNALGIKTQGKSDTRFGAENANPSNEVFYQDPKTGRLTSPKKAYNPETMKDLSDWYKNMFEGAPIEPELIDSLKAYITDFKASQFRRAANENKPISKYKEAEYKVQQYTSEAKERNDAAKKVLREFIDNLNDKLTESHKMSIEEVRKRREELKDKLPPKDK